MTSRSNWDEEKLSSLEINFRLILFGLSDLFVDANDFQMCIYDRWGKQVLIVEDPAEGWDGSYNGSDAPSGAYVYHLKYTNSKGSFFEKLGSITLYR